MKNPRLINDGHHQRLVIGWAAVQVIVVTKGASPPAQEAAHALPQTDSMGNSLMTLAIQPQRRGLVGGLTHRLL